MVWNREPPRRSGAPTTDPEGRTPWPGGTTSPPPWRRGVGRGSAATAATCPGGAPATRGRSWWPRALQQTQVARVVARCPALLGGYPDPAACAAAPLADVLRAWHGLGYNRRAVTCTALPPWWWHPAGVRSVDLELLSLPGVGPVHGAGGPGVRARRRRGRGRVDTKVRVLARAGGAPPPDQTTADGLVPPDRAGRGTRPCSISGRRCALGCRTAGVPAGVGVPGAAAGRPTRPVGARTAAVTLAGSDRQGRGPGGRAPGRPCAGRTPRRGHGLVRRPRPGRPRRRPR